MDSLQVIAEPTRRRILELVWSAERSAGDIAASFDTTFGAVSQHLAILRREGLVSVRKEGNRRYYKADHDALGPLRPVLESMWAAALDDLAAVIEDGPS